MLFQLSRQEEQKENKRKRRKEKKKEENRKAKMEREEILGLLKNLIALQKK